MTVTPFVPKKRAALPKPRTSSVVAFQAKKRAAPAKLPKVLEKHIQKAIVRQLEACGFMVEIIRQGAMTIPREGKKGRFVRLGCRPGTPDLMIICARGVFLEVKRPGEHLTEHQVQWHFWARRQGAFVAVVRSVEEALAAAKAATTDANDRGERWAA